MKLSDFLSEHKLSHAEFGRKIERSAAAVSRYVSGSRIPRPDDMVKIIDVTGGAVTPNDFLPVGTMTEISVSN